MNTKTYIRLTPFFLFYFTLTLLVSDNIFFWDTVQLGSKHAHFFYETNFSQLLLPNDIDSGHIPTFGMYLALAWKIFGKNLLVSHLAMFPFLFGIVIQAFLLLKKFITEKYIYYALLIFLSDATLLSQSTLISPDIALVFFFLLGLNAVLSEKKVILSMSITGLFLVSMRGMMVAFAILIIDIVFNIKRSSIKSILDQLLRKSFIYLPALLIFIFYNYIHFTQKGWIGYHEDSPWAISFQPVDFKGFLFNIGLLGWRMIDFGRIFLWVTTCFIGIKYFKAIKHDKKFLRMSFILVILTLTLSYSFLMYKYLSGHRYILPLYLVFSLITIYLIFEKIQIEKVKYILFAFVLIGSLTGNFWVYPKKISQGWDASLAHLNYYKLRNEMMVYMKKEGIKIQDVGCAFPNITEQKFLDLSNNMDKHPYKNLDTDKYVLYSNVYNEFEDNEIDRLETKFTLVKEFRQLGVFIQLYRK